VAAETHAVADARAPVRAFFEDGPVGWAFEAAVRAPENLASPHAFGWSNWMAAQSFGGEWDGEDLADFLGEPVPELALVPPEADLLRDWPAIASPAAALLAALVDRGLPLAAASCLAYQKRPLLFPIFNRATRLALGLPAGVGPRDDLPRLGLERLRAAALLPENQGALDRLQSWLADRPYATRLLTLSRVRLVNLIASGLPGATGAPPRRQEKRGRKQRSIP